MRFCSESNFVESFFYNVEFVFIAYREENPHFNRILMTVNYLYKPRVANNDREWKTVDYNALKKQEFSVVQMVLAKTKENAHIHSSTHTRTHTNALTEKKHTHTARVRETLLISATSCKDHIHDTKEPHLLRGQSVLVLWFSLEPLFRCKPIFM